MLNFSFCSPTQFVFGENTESQAGELVKAYGGKKALIHFGAGSVVRSGLLGRVEASLKAKGIEIVQLGGALPNPRSGLVYQGIELCRKEKVDFIVAVGGGSTIDSAKAIAAGVPYAGDFWDFFEQKATLQKAIPVGIVLTIPAAGSEGSFATVITQENGMLKRGLCDELLRPKFAILNPVLTFTLPAYQTACGAADIMAHVFERYFTSTPEVDFSDRLCEAVLMTMIKEVPIALAEPTHYGARANIMWAGTIAHNGLVGMGREEDWGTHDIEHEISALYDVAHGAGLAVMFPAWMRFQLKHDVMRFAQIAVRVWGCEMDFANPERTALEGIERLVMFFRYIGLPTTLSELGVQEGDVPMLAAKVARNPQGKVGSFNPLSPEDIIEIYKLAR